MILYICHAQHGKYNKCSVKDIWTNGLCYHIIEKVERYEEGGRIAVKHPVTCYRSEYVFAEYYESRDLALPWHTWHASGTGQNLISLDGTCMLEPWEPPQRAVRILLALTDGIVDTDDDLDHGGHGDAHLEMLALKEKELDDLGPDPHETDAPIDADTGVCTAAEEELTKREADLLGDPVVAKIVEGKLADVGALSDDPISDLRGALAEVEAEGIPKDSGVSLPDAYLAWSDEWTNSITAATAAYKQLGMRVPPASGNASLLLRLKGDTVFTHFIHWPGDTVNANEKKCQLLDGREVRVEDSKFVFSMAIYHPIIEFKSPKNIWRRLRDAVT